MKITECAVGQPVEYRGFVTLINKIGAKKVRITNTRANTWQAAKSTKNWVDPKELNKVNIPQ